MKNTRTVTLRAPKGDYYPITVVAIHVEMGSVVFKGDPLIDLRSHQGRSLRVRAPQDGVITSPPHGVGFALHETTMLFSLEVGKNTDWDQKKSSLKPTPGPERSNSKGAYRSVGDGCSNSEPTQEDVADTIKAPQRKYAKAASAPKAPRSKHRPEFHRSPTPKASKERRAVNRESLAPLPGPVIPPFLFLLTALAIWGGSGGISLFGFDYADLLPASKEEASVAVFAEGDLADLGDPVPLKPKATQDAFRDWLDEGGL